MLIQHTIELFNEQGSSPSDTIRDLIKGEEVVNVLSFHPNGSLRDKVTTMNGEKAETMLCTYDRDGTLSHLTITNARNSVRDYYTHIALSANGDVQSARYYNAQHTLLGTFSNVFDGFTRISAINRDPSGKITYQDTVLVNDHKWPVHVLRSVHSGEHLRTDTTSYQYDSLDHYGNWRVRWERGSAEKTLKTI